MKSRKIYWVAAVAYTCRAIPTANYTSWQSWKLFNLGSIATWSRFIFSFQIWWLQLDALLDMGWVGWWLVSFSLFFVALQEQLETLCEVTCGRQRSLRPSTPPQPSPAPPHSRPGWPWLRPLMRFDGDILLQILSKFKLVYSAKKIHLHQFVSDSI